MIRLYMAKEKCAPWKKEGKIIVTVRDYDQVRRHLFISHEDFTPGAKVLSIGEGFSEYSTGLRGRGVDAIAMDPVYLHGSSYERFSDDEERLRLDIYSQDRRYPPFFDEKTYSSPESLPQNKILVGSVFEIPFADKTFDNVISNKVHEHINDFRTAILESARVMKDSGEVRWGGMLLNADLEYNSVYCRYWRSQEEYYYGDKEKTENFREAIEELGNKGYNIYFVSDGFVRSFNVMGLMIIRRDNKIPKISCGDTDIVEAINNRRDALIFKDMHSQEELSYLGKIYKMAPDSFGGDEHFKVTEVYPED
jgi:SAM-dependent methyltransferase